MTELTNAQLAQCDRLHNIAFNALCQALEDKVDWNIEAIGEIADAITRVAERIYGVDPLVMYPEYMTEDEIETIVLYPKRIPTDVMCRVCGRYFSIDPTLNQFVCECGESRFPFCKICHGTMYQEEEDGLWYCPICGSNVEDNCIAEDYYGNIIDRYGLTISKE